MGTCRHSTEGTAHGDVCPCPLGGTRGLETSLLLWGKVVLGPNPVPCLEEVPGAFCLPQKLPWSPFTPHGYLSWPPLVSSGPPHTPHGHPLLPPDGPSQLWPPFSPHNHPSYPMAALFSSGPPLIPHGHPISPQDHPSHPMAALFSSQLPLTPHGHP